MSALERDAQTHARRLVHLAVHECGLLDDAGLLHLEEEVGALTGALPHAGEHGDTTVLLRDPVDHLHDEDGLADARAAEQTDLAALHVGLEEVDDLDAGLEHQGLRLELVEGGRVAVDLPPVVDSLGDRLAASVEGLAEHVEHVAEHAVADRHRDAVAEVPDGCAPLEAVGRLHADDAGAAVADLLRDLGGDGDRLPFELDVHLERGVDLGQRVGRELDVDHRSGDRDDATLLEGLGGVRGRGHDITPG